MKDLFHDSVKAVMNGSRFYINFKRRSFRLNQKYIFKDGLQIPKENFELGIEIHEDKMQYIRNIEEMYERFKYSVPGTKSDSHKTPFIALSIDELEQSDLMQFDNTREIRQIELELYIFILLQYNLVAWDDFAKGLWFWRSDKDKDLVIYREAFDWH